jgi:hypothetical protein
MHWRNWKKAGNLRSVSQSGAISAENTEEMNFGRWALSRRPVSTNCGPRPGFVFSPAVIQSPTGAQVIRIRRRRRRAPPRSPPPAVSGSAGPTARSRCRPRWPAVPERPPGKPPPMPADHRAGPASTFSQRDRPESILPRSTVRARPRGSSPRSATGSDGRIVMPARDPERAAGAATAESRRDPPRSPPRPGRRPRGQPHSTARGGTGASAPESIYATLAAVTQRTGFWECCRP